MDRHVVRFIQASLLWLVGGVTLGVAMAIRPAWTVYRPVHLHMLLLGFVMMMIAGVAYHVFPRFAATPLYSARIAEFHLIAANLGLALLASGFALRAHADSRSAILMGSGGAISAIGAYLMAWNLWQTISRRIVPPVRPPAVRPIPIRPDGQQRP